MELHILSGGSSRSRSSFKVKGQKIIISKRRYHEAAHFEWWKFKVKVILQGQGHPSRSKVKKIIFRSGVLIKLNILSGGCLLHVFYRGGEGHICPRHLFQ